MTPITTHSSPIRVVRIITRLNIGGPAIQALSLSSELTAHGFETLLVHGQTDAGEGDIRTVLESASVHDQYLPSLRRPIRPLSDARAIAAVYRLLRQVKPAIVHTHTAKAGTVGRLATLAYNRTVGRQSRARTVHTYHGHVFEGYFPPAIAAGFVAIERYLARSTDAIIAISPRIREEIVGRYRIGRPEQVRVVPLGFDLRRFLAIDDRFREIARAELQIGAGVPVITTVGRLAPIKRQDLFLRMAAVLTRSHPDAVFLVLGDGVLRSNLERQAQDLGLGGRVRFLGWRADLPTIYAATDVFVMTSDNEGTPVALIEAIASGVASVSTDVGGVRDVMTDAAGGMLVPRGDLLKLTEASSALLSAMRDRRTIGAHGRASVQARFGLDRLLGDISGLYRELIDRSG